MSDETQQQIADAARLYFLCGQYAGYLHRLGIEPRLPGGEEDGIYTVQPPPNCTALPHVAWMACAIPAMKETGSISKQMRWLGFMQGVLWCFGVFSIEDLKRHWREGRVVEPPKAV